MTTPDLTPRTSHLHNCQRLRNCQVLVVVRCAVDVKGVVLDAHSGTAVQWLALPPDLSRVMPLRATLHPSAGVEQHAYLLLSGSGALHDFWTMQFVGR